MTFKQRLKWKANLNIHNRLRYEVLLHIRKYVIKHSYNWGEYLFTILFIFLNVSLTIAWAHEKKHISRLIELCFHQIQCYRGSALLCKILGLVWKNSYLSYLILFYHFLSVKRMETAVFFIIIFSVFDSFKDLISLIN